MKWLSELEALLKAATPEPKDALDLQVSACAGGMSREDSILYFAARNFLPRLIAEARKVERLEAIERVAQRMDDMRRVSSAPDCMNHLASCAKKNTDGFLLDCTCGMDALRAALEEKA